MIRGTVETKVYTERNGRPSGVLLTAVKTDLSDVRTGGNDEMRRRCDLVGGFRP